MGNKRKRNRQALNGAATTTTTETTIEKSNQKEEECDSDSINKNECYTVGDKSTSPTRDDAHTSPINTEMDQSNTGEVSDPKNSFASIRPPLSSGILSYLTSQGFTSMTPVQRAVLPLFLTNKDVSVQAVTGSGKTLAFLIPAIEMMLRRLTPLKRRQVGALIVSPTRELARQTHGVAQELCSCCGLPPPLLLVGGGSSVTDDIQNFSKFGSDIVVGTPGRIEDILNRFDNLDCSELDVLILDEADVLLDMGFEVTLSGILRSLPKMRRTGLFSATRNTTHEGKGSTDSAAKMAGIKRLMAKAGLRNPVVVNVTVTATSSSAINPEQLTSTSRAEQKDTSPMEQATPSTLSNYYLVCPLDEKLSRLACFLKSHRNDTVIVFFLTCACVEFYGAALKHVLSSKSQQQQQQQQHIELLHGKMVQKRREHAMDRFRDSSSGAVLLCTDVAARGLDVAGVRWTVQFDAPQDPSQYVHRVGRCARAGRIGSSLLFLTEKEESYIDFLQQRKIPLGVLGVDELCSPPPEDQDDNDENDKTEKEDGDAGRSGAATCEEQTKAPGDEQKEEKKQGNKAAPSKEVKDNNITTERTIRSGSGHTIPDVLAKIRSIVLKDRDILEKGTKAFTSYIRAYKEHHCAFIFRYASLDLGLLATSFCLLRLPKMPELRDKLHQIHKKFRPAGPEVDIHAIAFQDKVREKARQKRLAAELAAGGKNAKQIKAERRAAERLRKQRERRETEIAKGRNPDKKRGKQARIYDEWDELAKEERLYKKLRKGKITKDQYKVLMYGDRTTKEAGVDDEEALLDSDLEV